MTKVTNTLPKNPRPTSACGFVIHLLMTRPRMTDAQIFESMVDQFPGKTYAVSLVARYRRELEARNAAEEAKANESAAETDQDRLAA